MNENAQPDQRSLIPDTTMQEDMTLAGQRRINLIWEKTQSRIAMTVVLVGMIMNAIVVLVLIFKKIDITVNQLAVISICLQFINMIGGIVIAFYFSRTNHSAIGGTGKKPDAQRYEGR